MSTTSESVLSARLRKRFASGFELDVTLEVPAGITILFGASGSGKTTALNCIAGLLSPDEGRIAIGERVLFDSRRGIDQTVSRRSVGYVFQSLALFPHLTALENVEYGLAAVSARERLKRARGVIESLRIAHLPRHGAQARRWLPYTTARTTKLKISSTSEVRFAAA